MTKPNVSTFDPATTCGWSVGRIGGTPFLGSVRLGSDKSSVVDLCGNAARLVHNVIDNFSPVLIAVEEPFFNSSKETTYATTLKLHGIFGAIVGAARARGVQVWPVAVATWRAAALGTSRFGSRQAAKQAMQQLCSQLGWAAADDNAADAGGIWKWATAKYAPYGVLPAAAPGDAAR